jgi:hypothetical protein
MITSLIWLAAARRHHLQEDATAAEPVPNSLTTPAITEEGLLEPQYCALNNIASRDRILIASRGMSAPLVITGLTNSLLCISMTNESDSGRPVWLYTNVVAQPTKTTPPVVRYQASLNYEDFGPNTPIRTNFQVANNLSPGYLGPINRNSYLNVIAGQMYFYRFNVYVLSAKTTATTEADALKACGKPVLFADFKSSFAPLWSSLLGCLILLLVS